MLVFKYTSDSEETSKQVQIPSVYPTRLTPDFWLLEFGAFAPNWRRFISRFPDVCLGETFPTPPHPPQCRGNVSRDAWQDLPRCTSAALDNQCYLMPEWQRWHHTFDLNILHLYLRGRWSKQNLQMRLVTWFRFQILHFKRGVIPYQTLQVFV